MTQIKLYKVDLKENTGLKRSYIHHPWESARAFIASRLLKAHLKDSGSERIDILDVGSGDLYQSLSLVNNNPALSITSMDHGYTASVKEGLNKQIEGRNIVLVNSGEEIKDDITFKAVLLMDVLEHIEDDHAFLAELLSWKQVTRETLFIITVPAWLMFFSKHDVFLGHYRRYTRKVLLKLAQGSGIKADTSGYFFFSLWLIRFIQFVILGISKKNTKDKSDLDQWNSSSRLAEFFNACLIVDYKVCSILAKAGIFLPGLSAFMVCRPAGSDPGK
jgi:hypothetical protein